MVIDAASLTRKRVLRNNTSLWAASSAISVATRKHPRRTFYDVIVVGAGISGALMAHALSANGLSVLVVDRRRPIRGSTLASTAMIQHEIDVPLHRLTKMIGLQKAQRVWQRSARAVEQLASLVSDLELECGFERKRTLFLAGDAYGARALRAEVQARRTADVDSAFIDPATLRTAFGINRTGAIESNISASANPARMTAGIFRHIQKAGVEVVMGLEVKDVRSTADQVVLASSIGEMIAAKHVVFCTGYEFLTCLQNKNHSLISTWALASKPHLNRPEWLDSYLVWEGAEPYLYFRSTPDGRVVLGGEDESSENAFEDEKNLV
ncbi:MAG: FAD-binding oxidoreductase, partial [Rhizobiaceae bacterium]|nr:FAD-binding oxidoreductase [Rhizobiaceae bacterium]